MPDICLLQGCGCALHPSSPRSPGCARGLGQGHTLVPASARARILGCRLVLGTELRAVCSQFAVTAVVGLASPCQPLCSPASWPGPNLLGVSPEPPPDPNGHILGRLSCACVCWDPGCPAPAPVPVPEAGCPHCDLVPLGTPRLSPWAMPETWGKPCWANVAASRLGAGLGLVPASLGPSLPGKTLPGSVPSSPRGAPGCPQSVPVPGARGWCGHPGDALGTVLGAGTWEQYPPSEPCPAAVPPPCLRGPEPRDGGSPGPRKPSPWTFPITLQPCGLFRAPHQPTTWR